MGTVETSSPEEKARNYASLLYSFGLGPKPELIKKNLFQRFKDCFVSPPKSINPSDKYAEILIAENE